ncbi:MAG: hypothetical protein AAB563_00635 [Patescibacteria group bacterium]
MMDTLLFVTIGLIPAWALWFLRSEHDRNAVILKRWMWAVIVLSLTFAAVSYFKEHQ